MRKRFQEAIVAARSTIEACVVVGGDLFSDHEAMSSLTAQADRGTSIRVLFPMPASPWLHDLVGAGPDGFRAYGGRVVQSAHSAGSVIGMSGLRWYDAPGPCWFVLIDRSVLFTKPFDVRRETVPVIESRQEHVEHFASVFDQLWSRSFADRQPPGVREATPPIVELVSLAPEIIARLAANPDDISSMTPERFELLIADRLAAMGLGVRRLGPANRPDGGIDIIAWPERNAAVPFLMAVQVKHSRVGRPIAPPAVREFKGVLSAMPIDIGLLVTNTRFTAEAAWAAREGPRILRLREFEALRRWLRNDFAHESWYEDVPSEISLGPGLKVSIRETRDRSDNSA
jgi:hypothetical protein